MSAPSTCRRCGAANPVESRFCGRCGALLEAAESTGEERKVVTVLFADLVNFTSRAESLDPEDVRALVAPYYARVRRELEGFGGTVEKFIGDAVMAVFGAPVAHEDDPERGVRAAFAIRDAVAELNSARPRLDLHLRVAVATGEAVVALGARVAAGEGMVSGDVVNTASRLQSAAPVDGILVGESTFRATERAIEYRAAKPVVARGKAKPVPVWEAIRPGPPPGDGVTRPDRVPLVDRRAELDLLLDTFRRARDVSSTQLVTLVGVPGIGKSRLVRELARAVAADPGVTAWREGRSLPYGEGVTYWALGEMVKAEAGILETDSGEQAESKLEAAVARLLPDPLEAAWVVEELRPLAGVAGAPSYGDSKGRAFAAWRRFFEALAEQGPAVLVFEDLHWADEGLLEFVDDLVEWVSDVPLLVLATSRPELLERRPSWGGGKRNSATASLSPLTAEETAKLVDAHADEPVPPETRAAVVARADGNPLYAEEYARLQRGVATDLPLPESVLSVIAARIDGLPAQEKELAQDAAVIGNVFWLGALADVAASSRKSVEERLHALERKEFVKRRRRSSVAGEGEFTFHHVLVRDVAYGQIPRRRRAEKHRNAAEWIASLGAERLEDRAEMLAHHYERALEYAHAAGTDTAALGEPARLAFRDAGDRAATLSAFEVAGAFYEKALALWPREDPGRAVILLSLGRARFFTGEADADVLAQARDELLAAGTTALAAEAEALLGMLAHHRGERERMFTHLEAAAGLVDGLGPSRSKAEVLVDLAGALAVADEFEQALSVAKDVLEIAESLGLQELSAWALAIVGEARWHLGDRGGEADLERSIALSDAINSPRSVYSYGNLADLVGSMGDLERSFELQKAARRRAERYGLTSFMRWLQVEQVGEEYWRGRWDAALARADAFLAEVEAGAPHFMWGSCRVFRGWIRLGRGETDGALEDSEHALEFARAAKDLQILYPALAFRARVLVAGVEREKAAACADELLALWRERRDVSLAFHWILDLAYAVDRLGRGVELRETAALARTRTRWLEAATAYASGRFLDAAQIMASIGSRPDEALARLRAAEGLFAAGRAGEAKAELERARSFFERVRASALVREAEMLLASSEL
jgi:class 3 adenylate cyclase/tetratricopeptide (TPR) repeat protein